MVRWTYWLPHGQLTSFADLAQRVARGPVEELNRSHHRFFERTGIPPDNLRFCIERSQKAGHCASLGITHFIDDRADVLDHLEGVVLHRYLFGPQRKPVGSRRALAVIDWRAAAEAVMASLGDQITA